MSELKPPQTYPSASVGPRFNNINEIPDSESEAFVDPDEAAENKLALTVISLLFGLVVLLILVVALYFVARDCVHQMFETVSNLGILKLTLFRT